MATAANKFSAAPPVHLGRKYVWEFPVRLSHWVNAIAICVLFATGLLIATPMLAPAGEAYRNFWMGNIRLLHFLFAMLLLLGVLIRVYWFFAGSNYARSGFPRVWDRAWYADVLRTMITYTKPFRGHSHIGHNPLAGACYLGFFALCAFEGVTGMALYGESNPGGFWDLLAGWTTPLLGGSFRVHTWHHLVAWLIFVFSCLHIYLVIYNAVVERSGIVDSIIGGAKYYEEGDHDAKHWLS